MNIWFIGTISAFYVVFVTQLGIEQWKTYRKVGSDTTSRM
jgi:hypothetical protein